jgi:hypothetical protein
VGKRSLWRAIGASLVAGTALGYALGAAQPPASEPAARAAGLAAAAAASGRLEPLGVLLPANEASAIVASRQRPGLYFWLRDGGSSKPGRPRDALWGMRLDAEGRPVPVRGEELFPAYPVEGGRNDDWEALAVDDAGAVWIGQLGANDCTRRQKLLRLPEPDPAGRGALPVLASYDLRFPDNAKKGCRTFNSEAMFWLDGHMYLFAKTGGSPVYRVDLPEGPSGVATVTRIGQVGQGVDNISASSLSDDRTRLMLLDHERLWIFEADPARTGDDLVRDAFGNRFRWQARFVADGGASVEGGTWARGSHRLAFVAEDRHIYLAQPAMYGDTTLPTTPPLPSLPPIPSLPPLPTFCPTPPPQDETPAPSPTPTETATPTDPAATT